ncbi:hypothetical protein BC941DRAFT_410596 [Chlamydoabsidia padenii]|nr:hypothetical protein BC941DRAFT_410596 [Chlamydoabsidia padenii]
MRSFSLITYFFCFFAAAFAMKMNYWDMTDRACGTPNDCWDSCKKFAADNKATLKRVGCMRCSGWIKRYCQCSVTGEINDGLFMDRQTSQGQCRR